MLINYSIGHKRSDGSIDMDLFSATLEVDLDSVLETVFAVWNSDNRPAALRSLSVGDWVTVRVVGGVCEMFEVLPVGWQKVFIGQRIQTAADVPAPLETV